MAELRPVDGGLRFVLDADEVHLIVTFAGSLAHRVSSRSGDAHDPILARFAPTASRGDEDAARELRAMMLDGLMDTRQARLEALCDALDSWGGGAGVAHTLDRAEAERLVEVLNDLRLALGASVGIEALDRDELPVDDHRIDTLHLMDHLGWMQGRLIDFVES
jgi:NADPH:quinone reductase-like Zn-dependent oxidoreductase